MTFSQVIITFFLGFFLLQHSSNLLAKEDSSVNTAAIADTEINTDTDSEEKPPEIVEQDPREAILEQIQYLVKSIAAIEVDLLAIDNKIIRESVESEKASLVEQRKNLKNRLIEKKNALEQIATGAVDISLFEKNLRADFSWQEELKEIFRPVIYELKQLTERPRQIEQLRNEQASLEMKSKATNLAIAEILDLQKAVTNQQVEDNLTLLFKEWSERDLEIKRSLQLVDFQLNEKLNTGESRTTIVTRALKEFVTGRGLNLLLAVLSFIITFIIFRYLSRFLEGIISRGHNKESRFLARLTHVIFQLLTISFSMLAVLFTLYTVGDWLILALVMIILVGAMFALRNSLPKYISEVRLLLNIGPVREGERVIYENIAWKVSRLNIYTLLINPRLTGGKLRVPLSELGQLISREWSKDEPWFPTKKGDFVILSDDTFGEVMMQTPQLVQIKGFGGNIANFPTQEYLNLLPVNLSEGFGVISVFGLDYSLQAEIICDVRKKLKSYLIDEIDRSKFTKHSKSVDVQFNQASASSLDLKVMCVFEGEGACFYYQIKRFLQKTCVQASNIYGWSIPFAQLTIHQADTDKINLN